MIVADVAPWLATSRDAAIVITAVAGALITLAAASRLPGIRRPTLWVWRQLTEDATAAYWRRHAEVATSAIEPRLFDVGERIGVLGARQSVMGDELHDLRERVGRIEASCSALPTIRAATADIARHTDTDRRKTDPKPPT